MDDEERPNVVVLRTSGGGGARRTALALKSVFAEMFPEILSPAAVEAEVRAAEHAHAWCIYGEGRWAPAWVTCGSCGLTVTGADWRHHDPEAWMQYVDPDGTQRAFAEACGLPLNA